MEESILTEETIRNILGVDAEKFIEVLKLVEQMIEDPTAFTGQRAVVEAIRVSAYRTKFGLMGNLLKTAEKDIKTRRRKDLLLSLEANLVENINSLKLAGRIDHKAAGIL